MPRGFTAPQLAQLAAYAKRAAVFVELLNSTGPLRVWNGVGQITALGNTYYGTGEFGIVDGLETNRSMRPSTISLSLAGIPAKYLTPGFVQGTRAANPQNYPLSVFVGFTGANDALLQDPTVVWSGLADVLTFKIGDTFSCSLTGEHYASRLRYPNGLRMSEQSHNQRLGNPATVDTFFSFQTRLMGAAQALL